VYLSGGLPDERVHRRLRAGERQGAELSRPASAAGPAGADDRPGEAAGGGVHEGSHGGGGGRGERQESQEEGQRQEERTGKAGRLASR